MVELYWPDLTQEQRQAILTYIGVSQEPQISTAAFVADAQPDWQSLADQAAAEIAVPLGHPLGGPIRIVFAPDDSGTAWAWADGNFGEVPTGSSATACDVTIPPSTRNDSSRYPYMHWLFLHEIWHCFEARLVALKPSRQAAKWVSEGEASWVAEDITKGVGAPPPESDQDHWRGYLTNPAKTLYSRAYDAVGYWAQLAYNGTNVWSILESSYVAAANQGSDPALNVSGGSAANFTDAWGSSWFRHATPSSAWDMTGTDGILDPSVKPTPQHVTITDGDEETISTPVNSAAVADLSLTAFVTQVEVSGSGRVGSDGGYDKVLHPGVAGSETVYLCTENSGSCDPPDCNASRTAEQIPGERRAAVTGMQDGQSLMHLRGISKGEWCAPSSSPAPEKPCSAGGCGGSNGDPHMKTVDGSKYDLQAAGEYVLLRAADDSVEMQARQEPRGDVATINTAVAAKVNGHRVGFYMTDTGPPDVKIDGQPVASDALGSTDLGTGATLAAFQRGYQLDFPDGTTLWALSMGSWGINVLVLPSDSLRADGVGIIARVPSDARFRIPALPDGSTLPAPANHDEHYQELYGTFAPAWRVTADDTLFDYDEGQTTDSYTVADFPPQTAPVDVSEVPADQLAAASQTCSAVTDSDLAEQCAFDVAVTGDSGFVTTYVMTDELQSQGTASLSEPPPAGPGATPTPPSTAGPLPSGINFVADKIVAVSSRVLGPNGRLYALVASTDVAFGEVKYSLLAIDPATGQIVQHADSHGPGMLAWAAGSLWAGEFSRPEIGTCQVSRLDPDTLAEQASVPTVCADQGLTTLAPVGDAVWFVDSTGAAADGTGQHLRRIDPSTNAVDASPAGNLALPIAVQFVNVVGTGTLWSPTSAGLIFGSRQAGLYRLLAGSETFDPLGTPGVGLEWYAAGDGVWTTTNTG